MKCKRFLFIYDCDRNNQAATENAVVIAINMSIAYDKFVEFINKDDAKNWVISNIIELKE